MPRLSAIASVALLVGVVALLVNGWGGIDNRCSDRGWSGCGVSYQLSGLVVLACAATVLAAASVAGARAVRRHRSRRGAKPT